MSHNRALNILLVGGESAGVQALRLLAGSPHHVAGVMSSPARDAGEPGLWNAARKQGFECIPAEQIRLPEFAAVVCDREIDVLLNVHSLYLIPGEVLDACRVGAFNLHPGPLPEYAGLDVPSWALYHGETRHGVTLHHMVPEVDAGLIAYEARFDLTAADTGLTVMSRCVRAGIPLVKSLLTDLHRDPADVPRVPQDLSRRRCFFRRAPNNGWLDWSRTARQIVDHIRAADYSPFPSPWGHPVSCCHGRTVGFVRAIATDVPCTAEPGTVGDTTDTGVLVAASDAWVDVQLIEVGDHKQKATEGLSGGTVLCSRPFAKEKEPGRVHPSGAV